MPAWLLPALMAGGSFLGGLAKNKQTQTTAPTSDPAYSGLQKLLIDQAMSRINSPSALPAGFETQGIGQINRTFDTIGQGIGNRAAAMGVSGGAGEQYANNMANISRGGQIAGFQTQIPLQERAMRMEDLGFANNVLGSQRYGQTTTTEGGGGLGGGLSNLAGMMGYLYGSGKLGGGGSGASAAPGAMPSLSPNLPGGSNFNFQLTPPPSSGWYRPTTGFGSPAPFGTSYNNPWAPK